MPNQFKGIDRTLNNMYDKKEKIHSPGVHAMIL